MRAFEVFVNNKKLCRAGIGDDGVLSAIVNWVTGDRAADLFLEVGGLISPSGEHVAWERQKNLRLGDEIKVKIVEATSIDKPSRKYRIDPAEELRSQKRYVRIMAKKFGWTIQARPKRKSSA
jgi:hypothetical protein